MIPDCLPAQSLCGRRRYLLRCRLGPLAPARGAPTATGRTGTLVLLLAWAVAGAALAGCAAAPVGAPTISGGHAAGRTRGPNRRVTEEELTQRLMAFADR